jgi:hypothetical protein
MGSEFEFPKTWNYQPGVPHILSRTLTPIAVTKLAGRFPSLKAFETPTETRYETVV